MNVVDKIQEQLEREWEAISEREHEAWKESSNNTRWEELEEQLFERWVKPRREELYEQHGVE